MKQIGRSMDIPTNLNQRAPVVEIVGSRGGLAEIIAARKFPGTKVEAGNDTFFQHRHNNEDLGEMTPCVRDKYLKIARQAGVSIGGKVYVSGLARFPGDPKAWISDAHEVKARCKEKGWECEGAINFTPDKPAEDSGNIERIKKRRAKRGRIKTKVMKPEIAA